MEVEPELFRYDFPVNDKKELLGYHNDYEIPEARFSELAGHIRIFYLRNESKQYPPGTLQDSLIEFLERFVGLTKEERHSDDFNRLLLTQPGGAPRQDGDWKDLKKFTEDYFRDKEAQEFEVVPETPTKEPFKPRFPKIEDEKLASGRSDEFYVSETESEAEPETGSDFETNLNLLETYERFPLSQNKWQNFEPMGEDETYAIDEGSQLNLTLTPEDKNAGKSLPSLGLPRANFIATPLGWSLLETPSCS